MDYEHILRSHRKKPLFDPQSLPVQLCCGKEEIKRIIPQREPVFLVDALMGVDLESGLIAGIRKIDPADPVFAGHFPDYPVYPGSYTLEMIGQLSLCMYYFLEGNTHSIEDHAKPVAARATRILGAYFLQPIPPGSEVTLLAKKIDYSGFLATAVGQAIVDNTVCCVSAGEVAIL
jgi:3-hydroxyacyl-[acyl-carrier-protein] dehydratase